MTTTFIISYIILALIIVGVINFIFNKIKEKMKRQQKEQQFTPHYVNQINLEFKASDLDKTTDQSTQRMTHEEVAC